MIHFDGVCNVLNENRHIIILDVHTHARACAGSQFRPSGRPATEFVEKVGELETLVALCKCVDRGWGIQTHSSPVLCIGKRKR